MMMCLNTEHVSVLRHIIMSETCSLFEPVCSLLITSLFNHTSVTLCVMSTLCKRQSLRWQPRHQFHGKHCVPQHWWRERDLNVVTHLTVISKYIVAVREMSTAVSSCTVPVISVQTHSRTNPTFSSPLPSLLWHLLPKLPSLCLHGDVISVASVRSCPRCKFPRH